MGDAINFSAFGGLGGVGSIKGLLATKKLARQLRLKCDELHAKGKYFQDTSVSCVYDFESLCPNHKSFKKTSPKISWVLNIYQHRL